jgi:hypothetical protein
VGGVGAAEVLERTVGHFGGQVDAHGQSPDMLAGKKSALGRACRQATIFGSTAASGINL